ncbi:hypothetical protein HYW42_04100 [Candidatus Daviesbacteria bacterium]|nr:hypothetical protein [Candidatus Daviesbacteria bacterium]
MTATAHALVGGAIAASMQNPVLGITLSAVSHPLLDLIPHWDFGWGWRQKTKLRLFLEATFDLVFGFLLAYLLFGRNIDFWYFSAAVLASEIWDILEAPYWFFGWKFPPFGLIYKIQSSLQGKTKTMQVGILNQVLTVTGIVLVLRLFN